MSNQNNTNAANQEAPKASTLGKKLVLLNAVWLILGIAVSYAVVVLIK